MGSEKVAKDIASRVLAEFPDENIKPSGLNQLPEGMIKDIVKETPEAVEGVSWETPKPGDEVTIQYCTFEADASEVASTRNTSKPTTFILGKGQLGKGLDLGIATMKKGEVAKFTLAPYGGEADATKTSPDASLVFEVELISWVAKQDLFEDGGVIKSIVKKGATHHQGWRSPKVGEDVVIYLQVTKAGSADGSVIQERMNFEYNVGSSILGCLAKVVDKALLTMKKGEDVLLVCSKDYSDVDQAPDGCTIKLTLLEFLEIVDVSLDKRGVLLKKRVKEGDWWDKPAADSRVKLQVESVGDGLSPLQGFCGPKLLEFIAGNGEVCDALELTVVEMRKGERAVITCTQPSLFCGPELGLTSISSSEVVVTVEVIAHEKGEDPWHMTEEKKYQYCIGCKETGSALFKKGRHAVALQRYKRVTELLAYIDSFTEVDKDQAKELKISCELNKAACMLKIGDNDGVKTACGAVLREDKDNIKAMFRRASAFLNGSEFTEAMQDVKRILELDASNADARRLHQQIQSGRKDADKSTKDMYANMAKKSLGKLNTPDIIPRTEAQQKEDEIKRLAELPSSESFKDLFYKPGEERRSDFKPGEF